MIAQKLQQMKDQLTEERDRIDAHLSRVLEVERGNPDFELVHDSFDPENTYIITIGDEINTKYGQCGTLSEIIRDEQGKAVKVKFFDGVGYYEENISRLS